MAYCNYLHVVGCVNPLSDHFVENASLNDPKFLSLVKGEKKCIIDIGHVIGDEKYEWMRLKMVIRWVRIKIGNIY